MRMIQPDTFHLVSLGCAKNTVDSASMSRLLERDGLHYEENISRAQIIVVNTCGFIEPARQESITVLSDLSAKKQPGQLLIAAGCLTQRYGQELTQKVAGLDGILGTRHWMDIVTVVKNIRQSHVPQPVYHLPEHSVIQVNEEQVMRAAMQGGSAYLKIADGCRRPCAFCAIPLIKGAAISRSMDDILRDARLLQTHGVKELILIAQDTTDYGHDLGIKDGLAKLLEALVRETPDVSWLRIMYAYPGYVTDRLIDAMASFPQVLPYIDMPLQHAHPDVLRRMQRPANIGWIHRTLEKMRKILPALALRTTFIVGYPGETEAEFQTLLDFVKEIHFDRVGAFQFSFELGTPSEKLGDPIPPEVKQMRFDLLMELQQSISLQINQSQVGRTLDVLIEGQGEMLDEIKLGKNKNKISIGRSYRDAPEIDGFVFVEGDFPSGAMLPVLINGAMPYDLSGTVVPHSQP